MPAEHAALNRSLRDQRGVFLAFIAVELVAAAVSLHLSMQVEGPGMLHYQLQLTITALVVAMLGLCTFIGVSDVARPTILVVGAVVFTLYCARMGYALYLCAQSVSGDLPPLFAHSVTAVVFPFAILRLRQATWLASAAVLVFALMTAVGVAVGGISLQSTHAMEVLQQTLLVNPAVLLLLKLSVEVQSRLQEQAVLLSQYQSISAPPADHVEGSARQAAMQSGLLTTAEYVRATRRAGSQAHQKGNTLMIAVLDLLSTELCRPGKTPESRSSVSLARFLHLRLRELFGSAALIGHISKSRFAITCETTDIDTLMDRVLDFAMEQNGYGEEDGKRVALGLVEYRVGESVYTTMERAERAVERAKPAHSTGVSYSLADFSE